MERRIKILSSILKNLILFIIGGMLYYIIEVIYRGHSHYSMFIVGGLCFIFIGWINKIFSWDMYFELQVLIGDLVVLILEFTSGCILNLWLKLNIWDYSNIKFNILGQVCLGFALIWLPIIAIAIVLDDYARELLFDEEQPRYRFWFKELYDKIKKKK